MSLYIVILTLLLHILGTVRAAPADSKPTSYVPSPLILEAPQSLEFLKKFGYLNAGDGSSDGKLELLYSQESVESALKEAQRFGGIKQSGKLDEETKKLFQSKRCGLPDIMTNFTEVENELPKKHNHHHHHHNHHHHHHHHQGPQDHQIAPAEPLRRNKRFIVASRGWNKRRLNYFIENWTPRLTRNEVEREIRRALDTWGKYGHLKFSQVSDPRESDITFGFYTGTHGDWFAFDGPGKVLAHAFFPSNLGQLAGDVHFDGDEPWMVNPGKYDEAVDFSTVALHELGHSLGLSHSPEPDSVMNPYYKGKGADLGYDDILAMHKLYLSRHLPGDDEDHYFDEDEDVEWNRRRHWEEDRPRNRPPYFPPSYPTVPGTTPSRPTVLPPRRYYPTTTMQSDEEYHDRDNVDVAIPRDEPTTATNQNDICNKRMGGIDSASFIRGELFITKDQMLWRLYNQGQLEQGYPVKFRTFFHKLPETIEKIDEMYERPDSSIVFFYGKEYLVFDGYNFIEDTPKNIAEYGIPQNVDKLDAAFYSPSEKFTYLFSGTNYWKYNETSRTLDDSQSYPRSIFDFKGIPSHLDAALYDKNGNIFIFHDDAYWKLDTVRKLATKEGDVYEQWLSC